ncbi:MAG: hydroxysqualene dehydroxylase HpnE [Alphaproteobacteria bacterium]|nr:hydroxysqualene dehydroxylase HpnE [Alphaproteobacteria bacterium]
MATVHIIGAGLAGLSAAVELSQHTNFQIALYETSDHAGGRCRSFYDSILGCEIDNGNHLILGANKYLFRFLNFVNPDDISSGFFSPSNPAIPFIDLKNNHRWLVHPKKSFFPYNLIEKKYHIPGQDLASYYQILKLLKANHKKTLHSYLPLNNAFTKNFWEPLCLAIMNAHLDEASAILFVNVLKKVFFNGKDAYQPFLAYQGLSHALIEPALKFLKNKNIPIHYHASLKRIESRNTKISDLYFGNEQITLAQDDKVIFALPPFALTKIIPALDVPKEYRSIINIHMILPKPLNNVGEVKIIGLINSYSQWVFCRHNILSITISAADSLLNLSDDELSTLVWPEMKKTLNVEFQYILPADFIPTIRIIREKRATFLQTPLNISKRPNPSIFLSNTFLAGDWINTQLPATIEGAVYSGVLAVQELCKK